MNIFDKRPDLSNRQTELTEPNVEAAPAAASPVHPHEQMPGLMPLFSNPAAAINPAYAMQAAAPNMQRYREMTLDELLLENRIIFLVGEINHVSATRVIMQMLYLQNQKKNIDINLYINSPGGGVDDTLAMYDTINFLSCDVATYCIGMAASGGAITLAAGTKGKRYILPHARVMIHQPYGGVGGQASDVKIQAEEILKAKAQLNEILAARTGQPLAKIEEDAERDKYFSAAEAKEYGLVDEVLEASPEEKKKE